MYSDCVNCEEQECIKGDEQKERNLRGVRAETELLLKEARKAVTDEEYGADIWVAHQLKTLERVNALLKILEDPSVPVGARIRLNVVNASLITSDDAKPIRVVRVNKKALPK